MRNLRKLGILGLAALELGMAVPLPVLAQPASAEEIPQDMVQIADNEYLTLYLDEEETDVAVLDKASGHIWYSNPQNPEEDTNASAYYQKVLKSQLQIQYYNDNVQSNVMDNYNDSISHGQFEIERLEDGVTITYTFGEPAGNLILPEVISSERLEQFMTHMSEKAQKKVKRNYSEENETYVLRGGVKDYIKEELAGYFEEAGYTQQDYEMDSSQDGGEESDKPWFSIPLTYRLDGENLVVCVDPEAVTYNENGYYLVDIDILPYFGAAGAKEEGYLFVPDGSGALIYLNNGKTDASSYSACVYGQDRSKQMLATSKSEIDERLTVKLPVYGIKAGDNAMFAIVEDGAGYADISADIAGRTTSYNNVYAGFAFLQYGPAALSDMVGSNSYQLYADRNFTGKYQIRYSFLSGDEADYSGMAAQYRTYLEEAGVLNRMQEEEVPFYTEYIGAIDKDKTVLGVKYRSVEPVTTYAQADTIIEQLKAAGIENQKVIYSGWANGGLHGKAVTRVKQVGALRQNGFGIKDFTQKMESQGIDTFMTFDTQYVYQDKLLDGYSKMQYAAGYFDHSNIEVGNYSVSNGMKNGKKADLISPAYALQMAACVQKGVNKYHLTGINLGTMSWELYSDYLENRYTDRQKAISLYQESLEQFKNNNTQMLGDNANAYILDYVTDVINVPLSSNGYQILDEDVPFYEMVLHGYASYAGEALNMADDYKTTLLKSAESGAGLYYQWIYEDNAVLKETEYDDLYSVNYANWIDQATQDYERLQQAMSGLENQHIIGHERKGDVTCTVYEDGSQVYVNYGEKQVQIDGVVIPAKDYVVRKEGV